MMSLPESPSVSPGLTTIPQGIAYAAVAGLPLQVKKKKNLAPVFYKCALFFGTHE
jgi:hypothetical protein